MDWVYKANNNIIIAVKSSSVQDSVESTEDNITSWTDSCDVLKTDYDNYFRSYPALLSPITCKDNLLLELVPSFHKVL